MKKSKIAKKALLCSLITILLSTTMLIGTSFAWFTDTASTSVNTIKAGNLDVKLEMAEGWDAEGNPNVWNDAEGETVDFLKAVGASEDEELLWEPGCTYDLQELRISNNGNLALKYKISISGIKGDTKLNDAIEWTIKIGNNTYSVSEEQHLDAKVGDQIDSDILTISGHMKEDAGNEYQGLSIDGIAITVYATQDTVEYDSEDNQYDANASFDGYVNVTKTVSTESDTIIQDKEKDPTIKAVVPKDSASASELTLIKETTETPSNIEINTGESTISLDVKIIDTQTQEVVSAMGGTFFTINLKIGQVDLLKFYHKGTEMVKVDSKDDLTTEGLYYYDFDSGVVTYTTKEFSPFTAKIKFSGGNGSEAYPYLISNDNDWKGINSEEQSEDKHYKQTADIVTTECINEFAGTYDGGGYKLTTGSINRQKDNYSSLFNKTIGYASFKNINVTMTEYPVNLLWRHFIYTVGADFENITFTGTTTSSANASNFGLVISQVLWTESGTNETVIYNFKNITNNVSYTNSGNSTGVFIGSGTWFKTKTILNFINCVNNGDVTGASTVGYLYGNASYVNKIKSSNSEINVSNCKNTGTLKAINTNGLAEFALKMDDLNAEYQESVGGTYISGPGVLKDAELVVHQNGTSFLLSGAPTDYTYKLVFAVSSTYHTVDGDAWTDGDLTALKDNSYKADAIIWNISNGKKYFCDLTIDENATSGHNTINALDKRTAKSNGFDVDNMAFSDNYALVVKDGVTYLILDIGDYQYVNSSVSLNVYAYDGDGSLVGAKAVQ